MPHAYYNDMISVFREKSHEDIRKELLDNTEYEANPIQKNAWNREITTLKDQLPKDLDGMLILEYVIPRIVKRIDAVLLVNGLIIIIEFKARLEEGNETKNETIEQVMDYALDLKYFHENSHNRKIIPITCELDSEPQENEITWGDNDISNVLVCNKDNLGENINRVLIQTKEPEMNYEDWINARFEPVPTIVEATKALYWKHENANIKSNSSGVETISKTTQAVNEIIEKCKQNNRKAVCFITGVPGAGKTLVGLDIAFPRDNKDSERNKVSFLSGNEPLVDVLQEALARDLVSREVVKTKKEATSKIGKKIWLFHKFRDEAINTDKPLTEKITVFDEAQRAWDEEQLTSFMNTKKGRPDFNQSEPEFLLSTMDRHQDWAVIVCLIGGGQEIYKGEGGMSIWFDALNNQYAKWDVYVSSKITDSEYVGDSNLEELLSNREYYVKDDLHLDVDIRSFRSKQLSKFVKAMLDNEMDNAKTYYEALKNDYPIRLTRDLDKAKEWVRKNAHGSERYGLLASSEGKRLRSVGIWVPKSIKHVAWFLNGKDCVDSSYYLEVAASEFKVQGLEVDYAILAWDADFRYENGEFTYHKFRQTWNNIASNNKRDRGYMKNAYRVLLTRARQGIVIYVPKGDINDITASPELYNGTYNMLKKIGIEEF